MYKVMTKQINIDGENKTVFGIADESCFFSDFTDNKETAEKTAKLLNENEVESCHVLDIIDDLFYC